MGFFAYLIPPGPSGIFLENNIDLINIIKKYFILDKIDINYITVDNTEKITVNVILNMYDSYEERLSRNNVFTSSDFSMQDLIDKNFSENLWNKCYIKIKELLLNQNTTNLKAGLNVRNYKKAFNIVGELVMPDIVSVPNTVDTIPTQYQYLLEIDDHFN